MAWKLRKDNLKTETPDAEPASGSAAPEETAQADAAQAPVFDLSGDAFRAPSSTPADEEPAEPQFLDDAPVFLPEDSLSSAGSPIALGSDEPIALEPIALEPIATEQDISEAHTEPAFQPEPMPESDPIALPDMPEFAPEEIALGPSVSPLDADKEAEPAPAANGESEQAQFDISPQREEIAPSLVSIENETGLPKVAPFIVDVPPAPEAPPESHDHSIVIRMGNLSATYALTKDVTTIGRPDAVTQNYPDIEIELDDGISRQHAEIHRDDDHYQIVDVGSTNGSILNGEFLTPHQPVPLRPGDRIHIGERTELLFQ